MDADRYIEIRSPDDIRIAGTRVGVEHLLSLYLAGSMPEEMSLEFPTVSLEEIHGVIAWYLRNRNAVDAYLQQSRLRAQETRRDQANLAMPEVVCRIRQMDENRVAK